MHLQYDDALLRKIFTDTRTIALVGASAKPHRDSHRVMIYLQTRGYRVIPVNPRLEGSTLLGEHVYARLGDIPVPVDMVDIFRRSDRVPEVCNDAIAIKARYIWMQMGVVNGEAARHVTDYGMTVVMDRCPMIEMPRLGLDY